MRLATDCPHKERRLKCRGMCGSCYQKWWLENVSEAKRTTYVAKQKERMKRVEKTPERKRRALDAWHRSVYGMSLDERESLAATQDGRCACCREGPAEFLDHCHRSNVIRGLLCRGCNTMLGFAYDNPQTLRRAADYLETAMTKYVLPATSSRRA